MLNKMIHWSLANRAIIIGLSLILMVMGLRTATELPVEVHTRLLTHKWHELLVLTTSAYQAIHGPRKTWSGPEPTEHDFVQQVRIF